MRNPVKYPLTPGEVLLDLSRMSGELECQEDPPIGSMRPMILVAVANAVLALEDLVAAIKPIIEPCQHIQGEGESITMGLDITDLAPIRRALEMAEAIYKA